jgi:hypothetical protein
MEITIGGDATVFYRVFLSLSHIGKPAGFVLEKSTDNEIL